MPFLSRIQCAAAWFYFTYLHLYTVERQHLHQQIHKKLSHFQALFITFQLVRKCTRLCKQQSSQKFTSRLNNIINNNNIIICDDYLRRPCMTLRRTHMPHTPPAHCTPLLCTVRPSRAPHNPPPHRTTLPRTPHNPPPQKKQASGCTARTTRCHFGAQRLTRSRGGFEWRAGEEGPEGVVGVGTSEGGWS